jgi:type IV pilus assembly protein PilA
MAIVAVAAAGCGGDKKTNNAKSYTGPSTTASQQGSAGGSAQAQQQDAAAKVAAAKFLTEVETCFVDQQMYSACKKPTGTTAAIGSGPGQVEVSAATDATYTIVAHSKSGTSFKIVKDSGGIVSRTCDKPGTGGCKSGGSW